MINGRPSGATVGLTHTASNYEHRKFYCDGDSMTATGSGYATRMATAYNPARNVKNSGVGGENTTQEAARVVANTLYLDRIMIIWDKCNSGESSATWLANIATMLAACRSGMFLVIGDINTISSGGNGVEDPGGANYQAILDRNASLLAAYGSRFLDVMPLMTTFADRAAGDGDPRTHDGTAHLDAVIIPAIQARVLSLGYMNVSS